MIRKILISAVLVAGAVAASGCSFKVGSTHSYAKVDGEKYSYAQSQSDEEKKANAAVLYAEVYYLGEKDGIYSLFTNKGVFSCDKPCTAPKLAPLEDMAHPAPYTLNKGTILDLAFQDAESDELKVSPSAQAEVAKQTAAQAGAPATTDSSTTSNSTN